MKTASFEKYEMFSSFAFTLPFKAHWLKAPRSIFRLDVAKLKCGDECQCEVFVPGCSNKPRPFTQHLSSKREWQSCLFCPGTKSRPVKVAGWPIGLWLRYHEALISRGQRDISCLQFLIQASRIWAPVLSWWTAVTLIATKKKKRKTPQTVIKLTLPWAR